MSFLQVLSFNTCWGQTRGGFRVWSEQQPTAGGGWLGQQPTGGGGWSGQQPKGEGRLHCDKKCRQHKIGRDNFFLFLWELKKGHPPLWKGVGPPGTFLKTLPLDGILDAPLTKQLTFAGGLSAEATEGQGGPRETEGESQGQEGSGEETNTEGREEEITAEGRGT